MAAKRADVARNKFLQIRVGYLYSRSSKHSTEPFTEHTPTIEVTPRFYFPKHVLITSRSRGDLRFLDGVFTPRFRQRLKLERTFELKRTALTPTVKPKRSTTDGMTYSTVSATPPEWNGNWISTL